MDHHNMPSINCLHIITYHTDYTPNTRSGKSWWTDNMYYKVREKENSSISEIYRNITSYYFVQTMWEYLKIISICLAQCQLLDCYTLLLLDFSFRHEDIMRRVQHLSSYLGAIGSDPARCWFKATHGVLQRFSPCLPHGRDKWRHCIHVTHYNVTE